MSLVGGLDGPVAAAEPTPDAISVAPARLLDTRPGEATIDGQFAGIGRAGPSSVTKINVAGRAEVPVDVTAVIANLTIVGPDGPGFATMYPCTAQPPTASNINYGAGAFIANSVTSKLDANGDVCIFTLAATDILVDVNGFLPSGTGIGTLAPTRLLDTRPGEATVDGQFAGIGRAGPSSVTKIKVAGRANIPLEATAVIVNLTIAGPDGPGFATVYPCAQRPNASNINYDAGAFVANSAIAKLDGDGNTCIFTLAAADILVDVSAFADADSAFGTLTPRRLLETRPGNPTVDGHFAGIGRADPASVTKVKVAGRGGVPTNATAVIANLTIASPDGGGFATIFPCSAQPPTASTINFGAGTFTANSAMAKLDANGDVCVFALTATDIILDVNAYLPGTGTGTRLVDVKIVAPDGTPFPAGEAGLLVCAAEGFVPGNCAEPINATPSDEWGVSTVTLIEDVEYAINAFAANTGWPNPGYVAPDGTEFHFSDFLYVLGRDLDNGTEFVIVGPASP